MQQADGEIREFKRWTMKSAVAQSLGRSLRPTDLRHSNFWKGKNTCTACSSTHSNYQKKFQRPNTWALPSIHSRESEFGRLLEDIWSSCSWTKAYLISLHEEKLITICYLQHLRNPISAGRSELSEVARHVGSSDDLAREAGDNDKLKKRERFNQVYW